MELAQELFLTAILAVLFSFVVAKLVSVAMAGDAAPEPRTYHPGERLEEVKFEDRLRARGFESESRVELVEEASERVRPIKAELAAVPLQEDVEVQETASGDTTETDRHGLREEPEELPEAVEPVEESLEEEEKEPGECCVGEVEEEDDGLVEGSNTEPAPDQARIAHSEEAQDWKFETGEVDGEISSRDSDDHEDDDDWEGIERTELHEDFAVAAKFVGSGETRHCLETVGGDVKMQLYGLHKVATEGPCHEPQPMALKVSARAKWNAWQRLGNMSPDAAMEQYITLLSENVPDWKEETYAGATQSDVPIRCPDLSTICNEHPELEDDRRDDATNAGLEVAATKNKNSENQAEE